MLYAPPEEQPKQGKTREEMNEVYSISILVTSKPNQVLFLKTQNMLVPPRNFRGFIFQSVFFV